MLWGGSLKNYKLVQGQKDLFSEVFPKYQMFWTLDKIGSHVIMKQYLITFLNKVKEKILKVDPGSYTVVSKT